MKVYCTECQENKDESEFYKRFIKTEIKQVKEPRSNDIVMSWNITQGICKDCLIKKFTHTYKLFDENFEKTLKAMCEDYDLPFIVSLVSIHNDVNFIERLKFYIKDIHCLKQYQTMTYLESVGKKEKSDIDFINEDIKQLKNNIEKAIQKEDFNAHNKWMNSLRDALELRDKLEDKTKWKEFSSHYYEGNKSIKGENEYIALWEQNGNNDIRNRRTFKVEKEVPTIKIELSRDYIIEGDRLTIPMKIGKYSYEIHANKVDGKWITEGKCN